MTERQIRNLTASVMTILALLAVGFLAIVRDNATALGALISILSAATGWFLRGRVEQGNN